MERRISSQCSGAVGVDRELAHPLALGPGAGDEIDRHESAAGLHDLRSQFAERLLAGVELDADGDAVLGGGRHGAEQDTGSLCASSGSENR